MASIESVFDKYADSMEFVKLVWRRLNEFNARNGTQISYNDAKVRDFTKAWNRILERKYNHARGEYFLHTMMEEIFAELIFSIYSQSHSMIKVSDQDRAESARRWVSGQVNAVEYVHEYMSIDIAVSILFETKLCDLLQRPSFEGMLNACRKMRGVENSRTALLANLGLLDL